ncbi:MAG: hypothetical protein A2Z20_03185 [Bdellovibrionales bacterium RBG_16_40_8]|nr:MAG: hypothetical protein A2Z20_03185 [Bdellovibrionales bacterium RBG_16_40_8]
MLKLIENNSINEKSSVLNLLDPETDTWVVADLNSKNIIQTELLKKYSCLPEDTVLRVSELWQKIMRRTFSDLDVVSNQFISTILSEWLKRRDLPWARHPGAANILLQYVAIFLPILSNKDHELRMREWLSQNSSALLRWGNWFLLSCEAWQYFCDEKILATSWVSAYLPGQENSCKLWRRNLIVDVGPDISGVEINLFEKISEKYDVTIFQPGLNWREKYPAMLWPYNILSESKISIKEKKYCAMPSKAKIACERFTTQISEVKAATAQIRQWLDDGTPISKIGLLAPDIEPYWPALAAYFELEGIPVQKNIVVKAISLPSISRWLSRLKIESQDIDSGDLEMCLFHENEKPPIEFTRFKQLFSRLYDQSDLQRDMHISELFSFKFSKDDSLTREQFFSWALKFWVDDIAPIERLSGEFLSECSAHVRLNLNSWLSYMFALVAKIEFKMKDSASDALICCNFSSAQNFIFEKIIMLDLSETALRERSELSFDTRDVHSIIYDLGIYLDSPDREYNEYLAERLACNSDNEVKLYFAATNFSGQAQSPSLFWLQQALHENLSQDNCSQPMPTRWDEIQSAVFSSHKRQKLEQAIQQDLGTVEAEKVKLSNTLRFSPSQIEKYLQCPFIFTAEKIFNLSDLPDVDLDMDAMTTGRMMHALLERLLESPLNLTKNDTEIEKLIDVVRVEQAILIADERLWPAKRQHFLRIAKNFLEFEKNWRIQYPKTHTIGREVNVKGEWQVTPELSVEVRGRIDRIDCRKNSDNDSLEYVILDYKSSGANLHNYGSWLKQDEVQLAFYTIAVTQGLAELSPGAVVGAFYYVLQNMNREKGFRISEHDGELFAPKTRNRSSLNAEELKALLDEVRVKIAHVIAQIYDGLLSPAPKDKKDCLTCHWRTLCRAPHLN